MSPEQKEDLIVLLCMVTPMTAWLAGWGGVAFIVLAIVSIAFAPDDRHD
jgi:hypothetical protein